MSFWDSLKDSATKTWKASEADVMKATTQATEAVSQHASKATAAMSDTASHTAAAAQREAAKAAAVAQKEAGRAASVLEKEAVKLVKDARHAVKEGAKTAVPYVAKSVADAAYGNVRRMRNFALVTIGVGCFAFAFGKEFGRELPRAVKDVLYTDKSKVEE